MTTIRLDDIKVANRHRRDYGDIGALADSIADVGLLQPLVVTPDLTLVAGGRRLEALRKLGWSDLPERDVRTVSNLADATAMLRAERDENTCRKDMTPSELLALGESLREVAEAAAKERQREAGKTHGRGSHSSGSLEPKQLTGTAGRRATEEIAESLIYQGRPMSRGTYERLRTIGDTANDETKPEEVRAVARQALEDLDAEKVQPNGKKTSINGAYNTVKNAERATEGKPPLDMFGCEPKPERRPKAGPARKYRHAINTVITNLTGSCIALDEITELDADITSEEAAQWTRDLSKSIQTLRRINNLLKERSK